MISITRKIFIKILSRGSSLFIIYIDKKNNVTVKIKSTFFGADSQNVEISRMESEIFSITKD